MSYAPVHSVRQITWTDRDLSLAGAATATVEREQLIGHAHRENCDIYTLSMTWPDLPVDGRAQPLASFVVFDNFSFDLPYVYSIFSDISWFLRIIFMQGTLSFPISHLTRSAIAA